MPVAVLAAWSSVVAGDWEHIELEFMDGPFSVQLSRQGRDVRLAFMKNGQPVDWMEQGRTVPLQRLRSEVARASKVILEACAERDWDGKDVRNLTEATNLS
jgi:hypothetical protein